MPSTSENNKRIAKNTVFLYIRTVFAMLVALYTSRVVLTVLGVTDFGIYNVVGGIVVLFTFLSNAMTAGTQRFLSFELGRKNERRLTEIFRMAVNIHLILGAILLILAETFGLWIVNTLLNIPPERFEAALWVYHCSVLSFTVTVLQVPYMASIVSHERMDAYAIISIIDVSAKLGAVLLLRVLPGDSLKWYAILLLSVAFMTGMFYKTFSKRHFRECRYKRFWNGDLFRELVGYSSWNLFGGLAGALSAQGVNVLLNMFFGPAVNAARGIAHQANAAMCALFSSFQQSVNPQIVKQYSTGNLPYMHQLVYRSARYSFFLVLIFVTPVMLETETVLYIWLGQIPTHSVAFIRIVLLTTLVSCLSTPFVTAAQATGKIKRYQTVVGGLLLLILPLSYIALRLTHIPESAFLVILMMETVALVARVLLLRKMAGISVRIFLQSVIARAAAASAVTACTWAIPTLLPPGGIRLVLSIVIGEAVALTAIYHLGMDCKEKNFAKAKTIELLKKIRHVA